MGRQFRNGVGGDCTICCRNFAYRLVCEQNHQVGNDSSQWIGGDNSQRLGRERAICLGREHTHNLCGDRAHRVPRESVQFVIKECATGWLWTVPILCLNRAHRACGDSARRMGGPSRDCGLFAPCGWGPCPPYLFEMCFLFGGTLLAVRGMFRSQRLLATLAIGIVRNLAVCGWDYHGIVTIEWIVELCLMKIIG